MQKCLMLLCAGVMVMGAINAMDDGDGVLSRQQEQATIRTNIADLTEERVVAAFIGVDDLSHSDALGIFALIAMGNLARNTRLSNEEFFQSATPLAEQYEPVHQRHQPDFSKSQGKFHLVYLPPKRRKNTIEDQ